MINIFLSDTKVSSKPSIMGTYSKSSIINSTLVDASASTKKFIVHTLCLPLYLDPKSLHVSVSILILKSLGLVLSPIVLNTV